MSPNRTPPPADAASPGPRIPDPADGLALIKPQVRALPAYALAAPTAARKLNQNESPYDFPAELKRAVLERVVQAPWQRYPAFTPTALVNRLAAHYGWRPDGVLVGNGSNELIQATLAVILGLGDAVVAPSPTFSLYRLISGVLGGRYTPTPLGKDFAYDIDRIIDLARQHQAKVVVLNTPNNPTGSAIPKDAVQAILDDTDAMVLCDEAYQEFGGPTAIPLLARSSRVIVLRTFSKAMGLAGLRFGVGLMHPAVAEHVAKAKLPYNVNLVTLAAAEAALERPGVLAATVGEIIATRHRTIERLSRVPGIKVYPSHANFFIIRCLDLPARDVFQRLLDEFGILVRDVSASPELADCLRISVGTAEDMDAVVAALEQIVGRGAGVGG